MPVTVPVAPAIAAIAGGLLLHVPPPVISVSVMLLPVHTCVGPPIRAGKRSTVTVVLLAQPVPSV